MHLGKRSRPNATRNGEDQTSKRQKNNDLQPSYTRKLPVRNNLPNNDRKHSRADRAAGLSGASRTTSAVQPLSNGTIIAPHSRLTEGDSQTLNIDTSNSTQFKNNAGKDKRTLRSHDGASRSKTELAQYFPNFDDIMSDEPKEIGTLTLLHIPILERMMLNTVRRAPYWRDATLRERRSSQVPDSYTNICPSFPPTKKFLKSFYTDLIETKDSNSDSFQLSRT